MVIQHGFGVLQSFPQCLKGSAFHRLSIRRLAACVLVMKKAVPLGFRVNPLLTVERRENGSWMGKGDEQAIRNKKEVDKGLKEELRDEEEPEEL